MGSTCLLVEDDALIAWTLEDYMSELGWETIVARDPRDALARLRERTDIELLITDIRMPGGNGVALALSASKLRGDLGIIFATGCVLEELDEARATGFPVLTKPFDLKALARAVRSVRGPGGAPR